MSTAPTLNLQDRLEDLISYIRKAAFWMPSMNFMQKISVMQENNLPPTVGREANLEREKQFLSSVKDWQRFDVTAKGSGEDTTFYETVMDWVTTDGTPIHVEQVVVAKWQNGKITHERYYHNP